MLENAAKKQTVKGSLAKKSERKLPQVRPDRMMKRERSNSPRKLDSRKEVAKELPTKHAGVDVVRINDKTAKELQTEYERICNIKFNNDGS